jgi:hypothetical protein
LNKKGLPFTGSGFNVQGSTFRVQRSGFNVQGSTFRVYDKEGIKDPKPSLKMSFSRIIANLAPNLGLGLTKLTLFRKYASQMQSRDENGTPGPDLACQDVVMESQSHRM